jgi:hypothetical protein
LLYYTYFKLYSTGPGEAGQKKKHSFSKEGRGQADSDPNQIIHVNLTETDTITLIDFPSLNVSNEAMDEVLNVKTANARYKEVLFLLWLLDQED